MLNLISLLQINWYSHIDSRATFLRRVRLKPADNSSRVVSAAAYIGSHLGSWDKLKKYIYMQKALSWKTLGCAVLLGKICVPVLFVPWKDMDFLKRKKHFTLILQGELTMLGWINWCEYCWKIPGSRVLATFWSKWNFCVHELLLLHCSAHYEYPMYTSSWIEKECGSLSPCCAQLNDQRKEKCMEDVKGYQQLPGIPACKKCCLLQRGKKNLLVFIRETRNKNSQSFSDRSHDIKLCPPCGTGSR